MRKYELYSKVLKMDTEIYKYNRNIEFFNSCIDNHKAKKEMEVYMDKIKEQSKKLIERYYNMEKITFIHEENVDDSKIKDLKITYKKANEQLKQLKEIFEKYLILNRDCFIVGTLKD